MAAAATMAAVGSLAQRVFGGRHLLGVYEYPTSAAEGGFCGPFLESAHCLHFLALGIGVLLWLTLSAIRANRDARRNVGPKASAGCRRHGLEAVVARPGAGSRPRGRLVGRIDDGIDHGLAGDAGRRRGIAPHKLVGRRGLGVVGVVATVMILAALVRESAAIPEADRERLQLTRDPYEPGAPPTASPAADLKMLGDFWPLGAGVNLFDEFRYPATVRRPAARTTPPRTIMFAWPWTPDSPAWHWLCAGMGWIAWQCFRALRSAQHCVRVQCCLAAVLTARGRHCARWLRLRLADAGVHGDDDGFGRLRRAAGGHHAARRYAQFAIEAGRVYAALAGLALVAAGLWTRARPRAWPRRTGTRSDEPRSPISTRALGCPTAWSPNSCARSCALRPTMPMPVCSLRPRCRVSWEMTDDPHGRSSLLGAWIKLDRAVRLSPLSGEGYVYLAEMRQGAEITTSTPEP